MLDNKINVNIFFCYYFSTKKLQDLSFQNMFNQDFNLTPSVEKTKINHTLPKDLTSSLIDSNINQINWSNHTKFTTSSLSQSKSMGFENKSMSLQSKPLGFENHLATPQPKPIMSLKNSANNWNDLWTEHEETQQPIKQLTLSDINDLLS